VSNSTMSISPEVVHHLADRLLRRVHIEEGMVCYWSAAPGDLRFDDPFHLAVIQDGHLLIAIDGFKNFIHPVT